MFLKLNKGNETTIFNLDRAFRIYIDSDKVQIDFGGDENCWIFYSNQQPEEYKGLKGYFEDFEHKADFIYAIDA